MVAADGAPRGALHLAARLVAEEPDLVRRAGLPDPDEPARSRARVIPGIAGPDQNLYFAVTPYVRRSPSPTTYVFANVMMKEFAA